MVIERESCIRSPPHCKNRYRDRKGEDLCQLCHDTHPYYLQKVIHKAGDPEIYLKFQESLAKQREPLVEGVGASAKTTYCCVSRNSRCLNEKWVAALLNVRERWLQRNTRDTQDPQTYEKDTANKCSRTSAPDLLCKTCTIALEWDRKPKVAATAKVRYMYNVASGYGLLEQAVNLETGNIMCLGPVKWPDQNWI